VPSDHAEPVACAFCNAPREQVAHLLGDDKVALCNRCFGHYLTRLDERWPIEHVSGVRSGNRIEHTDTRCTWCNATAARTFFASEKGALCDRCIDDSAPHFRG
jgi:hypothetical protein